MVFTVLTAWIKVLFNDFLLANFFAVETPYEE